MKIKYISNSIIPSKTANSVHVMKMCQAYSEEHEVILTSPNFTDMMELDIPDIYKYYNVKSSFYVKCINVPKIKGRGLIYSLTMFFTSILERDCLILGRDIPSLSLLSIFKKNVILEVHSPVWEGTIIQRITFNLWRKLALKKRLVVISDALKKLYVDKYQLDDDEILVSHDGADLPQLRTSNNVKLKGTSNLKVGYLGHLYKGKGMEVIRDVSVLLPDVDFHVVGGYEEDIKYWKNSIKSDNVFFYGHVSQNEVSNYISEFSVCLLPNQKEILPFQSGNIKVSNISSFTSPLKMFEYMAHKKAIVSSNIPVLLEVLDDKCSILVSPDDPNEWALALNKLRNEQVRNTLAEAAYLRFCNAYTWSERARNILTWSNYGKK